MRRIWASCPRPVPIARVQRHPAASPTVFGPTISAQNPRRGLRVERIAPPARKACSPSRSVSDSGAVSVEACMQGSAGLVK